MATTKTSEAREPVTVATEGSLALSTRSPDPGRKAKAEEIQRTYREGIEGIVRSGGMLWGLTTLVIRTRRRGHASGAGSTVPTSSP